MPQAFSTHIVANPQHVAPSVQDHFSNSTLEALGEYLIQKNYLKVKATSWSLYLDGVLTEFYSFWKLLDDYYTSMIHQAI